MARIRADLVGVVIVRTGVATVARLRAGDEVPAGATVGAHLLADDDIDRDAAPDTATSRDVAPSTPRPAPSAAKAEWLAYAQGLDLDVDATWSKAEIFAAVTAAEAD